MLFEAPAASLEFKMHGPHFVMIDPVLKVSPIPWLDTRLTMVASDPSVQLAVNQKSCPPA